MPTNILKNSILAVWAVFFAWLVSFGQNHLARLLHPRLWWLLVCGAVVLVLFLVVNLRRAPPSQRRISLWWRWPSFLILLVPILYFVSMQKARFNGQTFASRTLQTETGFREQGDIKMPASDNPPPDVSSSEVSLLRLFTDPGQYTDKEVEVTCQTLQDQRLPEDLMICYRFKISCCAADAQPIFVLVKKAAGSTVIANDTWIRVKGRFSLSTTKDTRGPLILAETITTEKEPSVPFIF